ncbi:methyltransferase [Cylindrobasidium torrendii FP15055 ss-10]|uniref:tRNA N(3)-methylcytidine methyltransferase n=1 Tax=Cylindrobasidium torrendii FP15055 ss-10 TaxID=1314674 RepID=A0A0D7BEL8_9AGAR|nr:methyltransferase [Cylindrobasidium torrendii FP15055 ss-10]
MSFTLLKPRRLIRIPRSNTLSHSRTFYHSSSTCLNKQVRPPIGSRYLRDEADVFTRNAWDNVVPDPESQAEVIAASLARQRAAPVLDAAKAWCNENPHKPWDIFYKKNRDNFFKDRNWLHEEFPELVSTTRAGAGPVTVAEVGCGAGNSMFPLLAENENAELRMLAYDYSCRAVEIVREHPLYRSPRRGTVHAEPWDLSKPTMPQGLVPGSVDIVMMLFVVHALHPSEWRQTIANVHAMLKPGGKILFRDYGRYDVMQLRLKEGRLLDENFYIRGDKTRVYFFELDELSLLFTGSKMSEAERRITTSPGNETGFNSMNKPTTETATPVVGGLHPSLPHDLPHPLFTTEELGVNHRLTVNRKTQEKLHRVWLQGKFVKL